MTHLLGNGKGSGPPGPSGPGVATSLAARAIQTVINNGLLDGFRNPLPRRDSFGIPQAANPLGKEALSPLQNMSPGDGAVLGDAVIGNALGGAENDARALANGRRYFNGSGNGLKNDTLCRRQRQVRCGEPHFQLYGLLGLEGWLQCRCQSVIQRPPISRP